MAVPDNNSKCRQLLGVTSSTVDRLCKFLDRDGVVTTLRFIRTTTPKASFVLDSFCWGTYRDERRFVPKLAKFLVEAEPLLVKHLFDPHWCMRLSKDEETALKKLTGRRTIGSVDSYPVTTSNVVEGAAYSGHYRRVILKALVAVNHRGFIMRISGPYAGNRHDIDLLSESRWDELLDARHTVLLGDGHFKHHNVVNAPFGAPHIKRLGRAVLAASEETKKAAEEELDAALVATERHGAVRARVEHCFSDKAFLRFRRLRTWSRMSASLLRLCLVFGAAAYNLQILVDHGSRGRYQPMDHTWLERMLERTSHAKFARHHFRDAIVGKARGAVKRKRTPKKTKPIPHEMGATPQEAAEATLTVQESMANLGFPEEEETEQIEPYDRATSLFFDEETDDEREKPERPARIKRTEADVAQRAAHRRFRRILSRV